MNTDSIKRKYRDSIFTNLFSDRKYLLKLYQALHPEDASTTIEDISDSTIKNVFSNDYYNDLGFLVKDKLFILVEAQSTWNRNIEIRTMMYLMSSYNRFIKEKQIDVFSNRSIKLPAPEMYVIYTGPFVEDVKNEYLDLNSHFYEVEQSFMSMKIKVIYNENTDNIIGEYNYLIQEIGMQIAANGKNLVSVKNAISKCIENNILRDYLMSKRSEVENMALYLYDEEEVEEEYRRLMRIRAMKEGRAEGLAEGENKVYNSLRQLLENSQTDSDAISALRAMISNYEEQNRK